VCAGDVGWSGAERDYEYALVFFNELRTHWPDVPLVIVPGNHDVDASAASIEEAQDAYVRFLKQLYGAQFDSLFPMYQPNDAKTPSRHELVSIHQSNDELLVVGVNSAAQLYRTDDNKPASTPVFVAPRRLSAIQTDLRARKESDEALRLFVVHHHLFPFAELPWANAVNPSKWIDAPDPTLVSNSARLQGWLASNRFQLVLHGHKHLAHGRADRLWRPRSGATQRDVSRLVVVGAGSAGVYEAERGPEPLSYNVIDATQAAHDRWEIQVIKRNINNPNLVWEAADGGTYATTIGSTPPEYPPVFRAQRIAWCHRLISNRAVEQKLFRNFMSIVEEHEYTFPPTTRFGERAASDDDIRSCFQTLHPEWHPESGWGDVNTVHDAIQQLRTGSRYQFRHGPRLFGVLGRAGEQVVDPRSLRDLQPIRRAVSSLKNSETRAYVGLYNPAIDVATEDQPLPGLVGIQFVPEGKYLDLVGSFRKLELSFWWVVNMYEMSLLLEWASKEARKQARRITFFAALAEWKTDPEAALSAAIDRRDTASLVTLLMRIETGQVAPRNELASLLDEKIERTNEVNIDLVGLQRVVEIVDGITQTRKNPEHKPKNSAISSELRGELQLARESLQDAVRSPEDAALHITRAKDAMRQAAERLRQVSLA